MRRYLGFLLMSVLLSAGVSAQESRSYIVMSGLLLALVESDGASSDGGATYSAEYDMDTGYGATLAFGFGAAPGMSGEIEVGYRTTDLSGIENLRSTNSVGITTHSPGRIPVSRDVNTLSLMVNGYYTFDTRAFRPYVGAGVGLAQHKWSGSEQNLGTPLAGDYVPAISDDDVVFAYQFMLGLNWHLADNLEARAGYRYFATGEANLDGVDTGYAAHSVDGGLIIRF